MEIGNQKRLIQPEVSVTMGGLPYDFLVIFSLIWAASPEKMPSGRNSSA
jgi:hypothetical protein